MMINIQPLVDMLGVLATGVDLTVLYDDLGATKLRFLSRCQY